MKLTFLPLLAAVTLATVPAVRSQVVPDLTSRFDADADGWRATDPGTVLTWQATGGADGAYLKAKGPTAAAVWRFRSPAAWAGDWSAYRSLRFDLAIPSRHYADEERAGIVVIAGANGDSMTWNGPTPVWTWTHFEISLDAASFGVSQATFDAIMSDVVEARILGEFAAATEEVGLDNVRLTATPVQVFSEDLVERFTHATVNPVDNSVAGWSPVDDVTFYRPDVGRPSFCLHGDDWQDGRLFKIASPPSWAGDWRGFVELSFDLLWNSGASVSDVTLVTIFGANGQVLTWRTDVPDEVWKHHSVALTPASFGVDQATFDGVMKYVNRIWIHGEFDSGNDQAYLDNVVLSTSPRVPRVVDSNLFSRFGSGDDGWVGFDNCLLGREATGGRVDGFITGQDSGSGVARLQSPEAWSGDWRNLKELRFFLKSLGSQASFNPEIQIASYSGGVLTATLPRPFRSWSPYTVAITPATFGVSQGEFDAVMADAAHLWIRTDLVNSSGSQDRTGLDEVSLLLTAGGISTPPQNQSSFTSDAEGWRGNGYNGSGWNFAQTPAAHSTSEGNPPGCITLGDVENLAGWLSPESWSGDWRGYQKVSFDINILQGAAGDVLGPGWMLAIVSPRGTMFANVSNVPQPRVWKHYEFELTPAVFGVSQAEFDMVMNDVTAMCIRSEWIYGSELEALDNVLLTAADDDYRAWLATYLSPTQLADEQIAGISRDPDGDLISNWDEYLALTSPVDPLSRFAARALREPGGFRVTYTSRNGRVYQVWRTTNLTGGWQPVGPPVPGDGTEKSHLDPAAAPATFFRVGVSRP